MPDVSFHFNVPHKLAYACRLARKAVRQDARLAITASAGQLEQLDRMLWELDPADFVAHCLDGAEPAVLAASPVLLTADPQGCPHRDVLVNLAPQLPAGYHEFARVIEIVGNADEDERALARQRWRAYAAAGHAIERFDAAAQQGAR